MDFEKDFLMTESHAEQLPTVRIKQIIIENFKSVKYGEILLDCGKQFVPCGTKSDILGIYGQNGSGKTALIEALSILKNLMAGAGVPSAYADCVAIDAEYSHLCFTFDLQYPSGEIRELEYSFKLNKVKLSDEEKEERYKHAPEDFPIPETAYRVHIFDEILKLSCKGNNVKMTKQLFVDTSTDNTPFGPANKLKLFVNNNKDTILSLMVNKKLTAEKSRSFIFNKKTLQIFKDSSLYSIYFQVLLEMRYFASLYFYVIDTKSTGIIRLNFAQPIYTRSAPLHFPVNDPLTFSEEDYNDVNSIFEKLSNVLSQIVPGLKIGLKKLGEKITPDGEKGCSVELVSYRNDIELPLRDESDGVRKIISTLALFVAAYNDQSFTLAIDEFDAGVFEYLLGELLQLFEKSGKGQFIFTSHNLRPLEVINRKFLVFTTTNPENRYYRLKGIGKTNNLRDTYFREIILGEQDEQIYNKTKQYKIEAALQKARDF